MHRHKAYRGTYARDEQSYTLSFVPLQQKQGWCCGDRSKAVVSESHAAPCSTSRLPTRTNKNMSTRRMLLLTAGKTPSRQKTSHLWSRAYPKALLCRTEIAGDGGRRVLGKSVVESSELGQERGRRVKFSFTHCSPSSVTPQRLRSNNFCCSMHRAAGIGRIGCEPTFKLYHHTPLISLPGIRSVDPSTAASFISISAGGPLHSPSASLP